jgi:4-hydroxy-4-methyl-2-oxoglutarate aldolase
MNSLPSTTAVADVLALWSQPGLIDRASLQPLVRQPSAVAGPARTVRIEAGPGGLGPLYELLSSPLHGAVLLIDAAGVSGAVFGEVLGTAARKQGVEAVIVNGAVRDTDAVGELGLWLWARAVNTVGPSGAARVVAVDEPVEIGGATVCFGDPMLVDADGLAVATAEVITAAHRYEAAERAVLEALAAGELLDVAYRHKAELVAELRRGRPGL